MQKLITLTLLHLLLSFPIYSQFGFEYIDSILIEKNGDTLTHGWSGGISHGQFSNFDANFDGVQDLFVFDRAGNKISVYIRNNTVGDVNFTYVDSLSDYFPQDLTDWVLLRDYNCDGKMDIFTSRPGGIKIYRNDSQNGVLSFTKVTGRLDCYFYGPNYSSNVYVSSGDIPGIEDIDGDGDLDIFSFMNGQNSLNYYRNYSVEYHGVCDSLNEVYRLKNECWGKFSESNSTNAITLNSSAYFCVNSTLTNPEAPQNDIIEKNNRHDGSSILPIDIDNSGVIDLVVGDIGFNNLVLLTNGGSTPNSNSAITSVDNNFPSNTTPVDLEVFPASFYVDVTNDGIRDLLVSTNIDGLSLSYESVWFYENIGTDELPNFIFRTKTFLQDQSASSNGIGAYPVFYDHNQDGLEDLIIGNNKIYTPGAVYDTKIQYYQNIGTASKPHFKYITDDYQNISSEGLPAYQIPTFGDLDGDGDADMILGSSTGKVHYFENVAGAGNPSVFNLTIPNLTDNSSNEISAGTYSAPKLVDLNRDGLLDLVLGRKDGKLSYYQNVGTSSSFSFSSVTDNLGGVNTTAYLDPSGYSVPEFVDHDNEYHLFLGSNEGGLYYYNDIDNNLSGSFNLVDSVALGINPGKQTGVSIAQLYDYHPYTMVIGSKSGGLTLYQDNRDINIGIKEIAPQIPNIVIFPNPTNGQITIRTDGEKLKHYKIYDLSGKILKQGNFNSGNTISLQSLSNGIYLINLTDKNGLSTTTKIVKE